MRIPVGLGYKESDDDDWPSVSILFVAGKLLLGEWQRIVLVECDGPRERHVLVTLIRERV